MKRPPVDDELLRKLEDRVSCDPAFSLSEMASFHEMVQAWKGLQSLGRAAKWVIVVLGLIAALVTSLNVLKGVLKSWLA